MVADRPPSQYPAFFAELLFWDSRGVTFENKQTNTKHNNHQKKIGSSDLWMDPPRR